MELWLNLRYNVFVYVSLQLYIVYFEYVFCKHCYKDKNYLDMLFCLLFFILLEFILFS